MKDSQADHEQTISRLDMQGKSMQAQIKGLESKVRYLEADNVSSKELENPTCNLTVRRRRRYGLRETSFARGARH